MENICNSLDTCFVEYFSKLSGYDIKENPYQIQLKHCQSSICLGVKIKINSDEIIQSFPNCTIVFRVHLMGNRSFGEPEDISNVLINKEKQIIENSTFEIQPETMRYCIFKFSLNIVGNLYVFPYKDSIILQRYSAPVERLLQLRALVRWGESNTFELGTLNNLLITTRRPSKNERNKPLETFSFGELNNEKLFLGFNQNGILNWNSEIERIKTLKNFLKSESTINNSLERFQRLGMFSVPDQKRRLSGIFWRTVMDSEDLKRSNPHWKKYALQYLQIVEPFDIAYFYLTSLKNVGTYWHFRPIQYEWIEKNGSILDEEVDPSEQSKNKKHKTNENL